MLRSSLAALAALLIAGASLVPDDALARRGGGGGRGGDFTEAASTAEAATARQAVFDRAIRSRDVPLPAGPATQAARSQDVRAVR